MSKPTTTLLTLDKITLDPSLQPRASLDPVTISEYRQVYEDGGDLKPIIVFHAGSSYTLADGWCRCTASRLAGRSAILAEVYPGGRKEAWLYAMRSNWDHGVRRSQADVRRVINLMLDDPESGTWNAKRIAEHLHVRENLVLAEKQRRVAAPILPFFADTTTAPDDDDEDEEDQEPATHPEPPAWDGGSASQVGSPVTSRRVRSVDRISADEDDRETWLAQAKRTVSKLCRQAEALGMTPEELVLKFRPDSSKQKQGKKRKKERAA